MQYLINSNNWPSQFPYTPEASVEVRNDHDVLYLTFSVCCKQLRALTVNDQGPVWEDSCVEFFCRVPGEKHYMNFEANCIGAMVASRRLGRSEDVQPLPPQEMQLITRRCSFPRQAIPEQDGLFSWQVELQIPLRLIFRSAKPVFPQPLEVNFYKCADATRKPHYLSWQPIPVPAPDFHRPEYFGTIVLS